MKNRSMVLCLIIFSVSTMVVLAHDHYTAYSSAPGSSGTCASSCHGSGTGTMFVTGIPTNYEPLKTYTITLKHNGGGAIASFNASTRKGTTTTIGGTFAGGTGTSLYAISGKETGITLTVNKFYVDSATFLWTAPAAGSGLINFYIAGIQTGYSGANTKLVIGSSEMVTGVEEEKTSVHNFQLFQNFPNPFNPTTVITYQLPMNNHVSLKVYDILGKEKIVLVDNEQPSGKYSVPLNGANLAAGVYCYTLTVGKYSQTKKLLLTK